MSVGRYIMHQKLSDGSYEDVYCKSESGLIYRPNGRTVEQDLAAYLPEYRDSDAVPESLNNGKLIITPNHAYIGPSKLDLTADTKYIHPSSKQCNYTYTHPSSKQCTGGDCSTLNGKSASQIIQEASSSASGWKQIYNQTHNISGWNDANGGVRLTAFTLDSNVMNLYTIISITITYSVHYRTGSSTSQSDHDFTLSVAGSTDSQSWRDFDICNIPPKLANSDNSASGTVYFAGAIARYGNEYGIFASDTDNSSMSLIKALCFKGSMSNGIISGGNLSGSTLKIEIKGR